MRGLGTARSAPLPPEGWPGALPWLRSLPVNWRGQDWGSLSTVVEGTRSGRLRGRSAILRRAALREPPAVERGTGVCPFAALSHAPQPRPQSGTPTAFAGSRRSAARAAGGALPWHRPRRGRARPHACRVERSLRVARRGDGEGGVVQPCRPSAKRGALGGVPQWCLLFPAAPRLPAGSCPAFGRVGVQFDPAARRGWRERTGWARGVARWGVREPWTWGGRSQGDKGCPPYPSARPDVPISSEAGGSAAAWPARRREPVLVPSWPLPLTYGSSVAQCRPLPRRFRIPSGDKP